ncbi:MAG: flagellar FliJ family protein [Alphaproteobacteria bacterium]|nr:flagellar FliJ family protein [Alphaproteobacteria bacterium]
MKKSLRTLIKLQKTLVDEQRQLLANLRDRHARIEREIALLQAMKAREQAAAARDPITRMTYGAFIKTVLKKEHDLDQQRQVAVMAVRRAHDRLTELFEEQKRYEVAEEQRLEEIAKEERRRETLMLDEIGSVMHERKRTGAA